MRAEPITDQIAYHGEGPVWSASWGGLRWVDMLAGDVLSLLPDGAVERKHVSTIVAAMRPRAGGGAVLGLEQSFALEDPDGTVRELGAVVESGLRFNDGGCNPQGSFLCGTMANDQREGAAALHRLDPDGTTSIVFSGVTVSNGLEWSPDGERAYYVDTPTREVSVFDGDMRNRRRLASIDGAHPDGLTVDAEGGVWVALYDGNAVLRFTPDGRLDARVDVPGALRVTACTFGGEALDRLFITTSREDLGADAGLTAGALHVADVGVRGQPAREFGG